MTSGCLARGGAQPLHEVVRHAGDLRARLDRLYQPIVTDLDALWRAVGQKVAA